MSSKPVYSSGAIWWIPTRPRPGCGWCDCFAPFVAAFARARPCCYGLCASLICCPAWQLVVVAVCQLLIKTIIIIIIIIIISWHGVIVAVLIVFSVSDVIISGSSCSNCMSITAETVPRKMKRNSATRQRVLDGMYGLTVAFVSPPSLWGIVIRTS